MAAFAEAWFVTVADAPAAGQPLKLPQELASSHGSSVAHICTSRVCSLAARAKDRRQKTIACPNFFGLLFIFTLFS